MKSVERDYNKNAFQWDVNRPLIDRIPCTVQGRPVSARGGGGVCPGGCILACIGADPPVDRQTPVKTQPLQTSFGGGKNTVDRKFILLQKQNHTQDSHFRKLQI